MQHENAIEQYERDGYAKIRVFKEENSSLLKALQNIG